LVCSFDPFSRAGADAAHPFRLGKSRRLPVVIVRAEVPPFPANAWACCDAGTGGPDSRQGTPGGLGWDGPRIRRGPRAKVGAGQAGCAWRSR